MAAELGVHDPESSKARLEYERMRQKAHKGSDFRKKFNGRSKPVFVRKSASIKSSTSGSSSTSSTLSIPSDTSVQAQSPRSAGSPGGTLDSPTASRSPAPSPSSAKFPPQTPKSGPSALRSASGSFSAVSTPSTGSSLMTPNIRRKHAVLWDDDDVTYLEATSVDVLVEDTTGTDSSRKGKGVATESSQSSSSAHETDDDDEAEEKVYDAQTPRVVPLEQLVVTPKKKQRRLRGAQARRRKNLTIDFLTPAFTAINMGDDEIVSPMTVASSLDDGDWEDYEFNLPGESSSADAGLLLMDMEEVRVAGKVSLLTLPDVDEEESDFDTYDEFIEFPDDSEASLSMNGSEADSDIVYQELELARVTISARPPGH